MMECGWWNVEDDDDDEDEDEDDEDDDDDDDDDDGCYNHCDFLLLLMLLPPFLLSLSLVLRIYDNDEKQMNDMKWNDVWVKWNGTTCEWKNELTNERTNERMNEWMKRRTNEWMNEWKKGRTDEQMNEWMNQWTNKRMKEQNGVVSVMNLMHVRNVTNSMKMTWINDQWRCCATPGWEGPSMACHQRQMLTGDVGMATNVKLLQFLNWMSCIIVYIYVYI